MTNTPEKPFLQDILAIERNRAVEAEDVKQLYKDAKEADVDVKLLRRAVRLALEDDEKKRERRDLEGRAEELLAALGPLADSPLGRAALDAAQ